MINKALLIQYYSLPLVLFVSFFFFISLLNPVKIIASSLSIPRGSFGNSSRADLRIATNIVSPFNFF